jgi:hypothetical protein
MERSMPRALIPANVPPVSQPGYIGYISQGQPDRSTSVLRGPGISGQEGGAKTITVALSRAVSSAQKAIGNRRTLQQMITKMEKISCQIFLIRWTPLDVNGCPKV